MQKKNAKGKLQKNMILYTKIIISYVLYLKKYKI